MKSPARRFSLLPRKKNSSKADFGHVLILAGSRRMTGAAVLAAAAALRSGAGLVTVAVPKGIAAIVQRKLPAEIMCLPLPETAGGAVAPTAFSIITLYIKKRRIRSLALGPGLSVDSKTAGFVRRLVAALSCETVLDADALNAFQGHVKLLGRCRAPLVLTPHQREFERLFQIPCPLGGQARLRLAKKVSARYHGVLVLKGRRTVVAQSSRFYVNSTGNPGLAKGGTGDVLTGILAAFLAQGLEPFWAASWAVYFHGRAADLAVRKMGELSLTASDVMEYLPRAFKAGI